jgi:hypothetical protein
MEILHDAIAKIVENSSGGIKFIELITVLASEYRHQLTETDIELLPERVEKVIRESNDLKILDYTFKSYNRSKMFVYTP